MKFSGSMAGILLLLALIGSAIAHADRRDGGHEHYDVRHGHNHAYPDRGSEVRAMSREAHVIAYRGERYWFHDGVWYRPHGNRFLVVAPPLGLFVPALPAFATLVEIGGVQYYYANEAYYRYRDDQGQYEVVPPPDVAPGGGPAAVAGNGLPASTGTTDNVFVYPKNGQTPERQATDRYECHRWAADQTGFDPTRPGGVVAAPSAAARRADYARAQQACLEARGYTVR